MDELDRLREELQDNGELEISEEALIKALAKFAEGKER